MVLRGIAPWEAAPLFVLPFVPATACRETGRQIQTHLPEFEALGAKVVRISPGPLARRQEVARADRSLRVGCRDQGGQWADPAGGGAVGPQAEP
ncbi:hypothetical protein [Gloeomargarita sp.]